MRKKLTRREIALCAHARRKAEAMMSRIHAEHKVIVRRGDLTLVNSTIGQLRADEIKRDGLGNCVKGCTFINLS